jgi:AcrR family transcriptional regulator
MPRIEATRIVSVRRLTATRPHPRFDQSVKSDPRVNVPDERTRVRPRSARPVPRPVGRRVERKIRTRTDLLEAGRKLFGERGLYESRIEDLAGHAGVAKGTVYQYFRDKDDLILAVVRRGLGELDARIADGCAGARTFPAVVARVVEAHLEHFEEHPDFMRTLHQVRGLLKFSRGARSRPLREALDDHVERVAARLAEALPARARRRAPALAMLLFGAISGVASVRAVLSPPAGAPEAPVASPKPFVALARAYVDGAAAPRRRRSARTHRAGRA